MDKYEFNVKVEQIRKLVNKGDYETAMKIADTIDWKKVRNANLLSMVSQVYEKNAEYQDAKDILLLAFERAPIGKRFLYKLTGLALKEGNTDEAEAYYREFCDLAGDDSRQHLLRYMILKAKNAPIEQQIHSLESYNATELDEKWLYELADLYHQAGDSARCVSTCDKIMLMFGLGKYVDKAMELKLQYAPLTGYQMDLVENREKYEAKLRAVEQSFQDVTDDETSYVERTAQPVKQEPEGETQSADGVQPEAETGKAIQGAPEAESAVKAPETEAAANCPEAQQPAASGTSAAEEKAPAPETKAELGKTRVLPNLRRKLPAEEPAAKAALQETPAEETETAEKTEKTAETGASPARMKNHLMVEARTPEKGLQLALDTLKKIRTETGVKNIVARTTGSKLNRRGVLASADKLAGKDLMIEEAGDLSPETVAELEQFMASQSGDTRVILIDNPRQMEMLHAKNPSLAGHFECIADPDTFKQSGDVLLPEEPEAIPAQEEPQTDDRPLHQAMPDHGGIQETETAGADAPEQEPATEDEDRDEEMDIDDFAQYACRYASGIDCSITGKSMLALYERIEIMEEDGIPLTKANAEALIEETADKAEKPGLKGLFSSKYDKDGLLILKEEHFIS